MDFDVLKRENGGNTFLQRVSIGGFCVKSQFILENREKRLFEHYKTKMHKTTLGQIFEKKKFWPRKKFRTLFPENIGKNRQKRQKRHFCDLRGKLTCVLQVKITLFYFKMVNSVMILQFWAPKIVF